MTFDTMQLAVIFFWFTPVVIGTLAGIASAYFRQSVPAKPPLPDMNIENRSLLDLD